MTYNNLRAKYPSGSDAVGEAERDWRNLCSADQLYFLDRLRGFSGAFVSPGIVVGLTVRPGTKEAWVEPGIAIDALGRQIVLALERQVGLSNHIGQQAQICISYPDKDDDTGTPGRTAETPKILLADQQLKNGIELVLADLSVDQAGKVSIKSTGQMAGVRLPTAPDGKEGSTLRAGAGGGVAVRNPDGKQGLEITPAKLTTSGSDTNQALTLEPRGTGKVSIKGGLTVEDEKETILSGKLTVNGNSQLQGDLTVKTTLTVTGPGENALKVEKGSTHMGGPLTVTGMATLNEGLTVAAGKVLDFATETAGRQMIDLWGKAHGIGVQSLTTYFRTPQNFAWYKRGTHAGSQLDPGKDGTVQMVLNNGNVGIGTTEPKSKLDVRGEAHVQKLFFTDANGEPYTDNWIGMADNIHSSTKWLHIGGISDGGKRRLALRADTTVVSGDLFVRGKLAYYWSPDGNWKHVGNRAGDIAGSVTTPGPYSDLRFKSQLQSIPGALSKIRNLRGVTYRWNVDAKRFFTEDIEATVSAGPTATKEENQKLWQRERDKRYKELSKTNVGVIAQEVEAVLPEAVSTDEKGYKSVRYHYLIPLLIEAIKEQDKTIKDQAQMLARQQAEIQRLLVARQTVQRQLAEVAAVKAQLAGLEAVVQRSAARRAAVTPESVAHLSAVTGKKG